MTISRNTLILVVVVIGGLAVQPAGQSAPHGARHVFVPAEATIEPLARAVPGGNAVLRVRFEEGSRPPERVTYQTEYGTVVLADDGKGFDTRSGDGLYTALGNIDLVAARARIDRLARSRTAMPTRTWRHRSRTDVRAVMDPRLWRAGQAYPWEMWGDPGQIDSSRSLLVRDLGVIEDASRTKASCNQPSMGVWSFGYLMEQMANTPVTGVTGPQFARAWLDRWMAAQPVNGWTISARTLMQEKIIDPWIAASGGPDDDLDLAKAPFRLLAIVNRLDLREQTTYGGGQGGELRFVFRSMNDGCTDLDNTFEVIFEYAVPASSCLSLKALANQWKALGSLALGSPQYNAALEAITQQVVVAGAGGAAANGSALSQIRTNENLVDPAGGLDWEAREFRIDPATHLLVQDTVAQTPATILRLSNDFSDYVNSHAPGIVFGDYVVPLRYPTIADSFRGGSTIYSAAALWNPILGATPIVDREARHQFALNTCNGCHYNETDTDFAHVRRAPFGAMPALSGFLTGISVADAADGWPVRHFDDLERRAVDMDALISESCFAFPLDLPLLAASH
ncbi:MAG: hypothetical protein ACHQRO_01925 [Vicinamibacteria bacterium]